MISTEWVATEGKRETLESIAGTKRRRERYDSESSRKRTQLQLPKVDRSPTDSPQASTLCPTCSFPCYLCHAYGTPPKASTISTMPQSESQSVSMASASSNATQNSKNKRRRTDGLIYVGPKDKDFERHILLNSGVIIYGMSSNSRPELVFGQQSSETTSSVLINLSEEALTKFVEQLSLYELQGHDENFLIMMTSGVLAKWDDLLDTTGKVGITTVRRDRWRPKKAGPPIDKDGYIYDWDIVPDITYSLSINIFAFETRHYVLARLDLVLADGFSASPYLTFEFKSAAKNGSWNDAKCQIASACVVWLHQRKTIRDKLGRQDYSDLRHYGIAINSADFKIWEAKFFGSRSGIVMQLLDEQSLKSVKGLQSYIAWSNAIHKWGLGPNLDCFKKDVEALIAKTDSAAIANQPNQALTPPGSTSSMPPPPTPPAVPASSLPAPLDQSSDDVAAASTL